jgi:hypothetical protein
MRPLRAVHRLTPAMPGELQDRAGRAPAVRRARSSIARSKLRHSPVRASAVPITPTPEEPQRKQSHHRSLHVVTSGWMDGRFEATDGWH